MRRMTCLFGVAICLTVQASISSVLADTFGTETNFFDIEFVTIGDPGNPSDMTGLPIPAGSVPYRYRIGKYEISEQMIATANTLGALGITKHTRGPSKPATGVSWFEAAKFVNWLNASTGHSPAYKFDGTGTFQLWQPSDPGYNPDNLFRNSLAWYFLTSVHEWYKSAYYDPATGAYFDYPTGSNAVPDGTDFVGDPNFEAIFHDGAANLGPNDITNVGVLSPFGTAGQGGNVGEWNESGLSMSGHSPNLVERVIRGGAWVTFSNELSSADGVQVTPASEYGGVGFRVASIIPEPYSAVLLILGLIPLLAMRAWHSHYRRSNGAQYV